MKSIYYFLIFLGVFVLAGTIILSIVMISNDATIDERYVQEVVIEEVPQIEPQSTQYFSNSTNDLSNVSQLLNSNLFTVMLVLPLVIIIFSTIIGMFRT